MSMLDYDEWPANILTKDEEQKQFHKAVSSTFLLMLDGNDMTLSMNSFMNLCRASEKKTALVSKQIKKNENPTQDFSDEDYGQLLDIVEGLKIHLVSEEKYADDLLDETTKFFSGIAESSTTSEDDRDVLLAKSTERRGSKPS